MVDCTIETGVQVISGEDEFAVQEIQSYATLSLFGSNSELKTEVAVFSSDCRSSLFAEFVVDTTGGARMAFAVANISDEPDTLELLVDYKDLRLGLVRNVSTTLRHFGE